MPTDHRIVAYHQTHGHGDTFVDLSPLGASAPLTHLIVAALHIADDGTVILNDHPVDDDYHTQLWDQLDAVRSTVSTSTSSKRCPCPVCAPSSKGFA